MAETCSNRLSEVKQNRIEWFFLECLQLTLKWLLSCSNQQILQLITVVTSIVVGKSTDYAKPHSICFLLQYLSHRTKDIFVKIFDNWIHRLGLENARPALCKWATCTRQTFLSKTLPNLLNMQKPYENNIWESVPVADKSADHDKPYLYLFLAQ